MNVMQLLTQLDELLYGVMTGLVLYPITLWRIIRRPWSMMDYADRELVEPEEKQFTDTIRPPLFLLASVLVSHAVELSLVGANPLIKDTHLLAGLVKDDTSLIVLRMIFFSVFPLMMSVRLVRRQKLGLNRATLKLPFYSQCYVAAPFALTMGLASTLSRTVWPWAPGAALAMLVVASAWYLVVEARWFSQRLGVSKGRGFANAALAMVESAALLAVMVYLFP